MARSGLLTATDQAGQVAANTTSLASVTPTWGELVRREPGLAALLEEVLAEPGDGASYCANIAWFGRPGGLGFKARMAQLVGWSARSADPLLRSSEAYAVAYRALYDPLPPCKACPCLAPEWARHGDDGEPIGADA